MSRPKTACFRSESRRYDWAISEAKLFDRQKRSALLWMLLSTLGRCDRRVPCKMGKRAYILQQTRTQYEKFLRYKASRIVWINCRSCSLVAPRMVDMLRDLQLRVVFVSVAVAPNPKIVRNCPIGPRTHRHGTMSTIEQWRNRAGAWKLKHKFFSPCPLSVIKKIVQLYFWYNVIKV